MGLVLAHPECAAELVPRLARGDFEADCCRTIWMLAETLLRVGEPVTPHNIYRLVGRIKFGARFDEVTGGMDTMMELLENAPHEDLSAFLSHSGSCLFIKRFTK